MFRVNLLAMIGGFAASLSLVSAQSSFHQTVLQTYSFQPHSLSRTEQEAKSAVLDKFWNDAKAHQDIILPELRTELSEFTNPPFFLYDGSMLLLSLQDTHENRVVALAAMAHCDLRDVQRLDYFLRVHKLASQGEDVTTAAFHVLDDPKFQVFIPQHVLTLGQDYVLIYLLLPMEEKMWVEPAIKKLNEEKDETAQKSLLLAIWYAQTTESNKAIVAYGADSSKSESLRKYAQELIKRTGGAVAVAKSALTSEDDTRKKRRDRMKDVSDEALYDLDSYTGELIAKRR